MVNGNPEEALKAVVLFKDGEVYMEGCTIGFLPRAMVTAFKDRYVDKTCVILEMYVDNDSKHKRRMDHRSFGACSFKFQEPIVTLSNGATWIRRVRNQETRCSGLSSRYW